MATLAYLSGLALARYGRWAARPARTHMEGLEHWPQPAIGASWHEGSLIGLSVHNYFGSRYRGMTFVPPGWLGQAMRGWLAGYGTLLPVALPPDGAGNARAALRAMLAALRDGLNTFVAVDGPHGPVRQVRPGALWLARASGRPLVPVGLAAWPAIRWPKWDRHILPLPGARLAAIYGQPVRVARETDLDAAARHLAECLLAVNTRAWAVLGRRVPQQPQSQ